MTCQNIKELLDVHIDAMSKPWKGCIKFKFFVFDNLKTDIPHLLSGPATKIDICDYLCGQFPSAKRLYFDPKKYPPPNGKTSFTNIENDDKYDVWTNLKRDLFTSAYECGSAVVSNGASKNDKASRSVCCH
jgi:hypothetical protein